MLARNGVRMVRLDAVGYAVKKAGTSCFMMPGDLRVHRATFARAGARWAWRCWWRSTRTIEQQIEIARHVDWVYDFALPPLVLHAFSAARRAAEALDGDPPAQCADGARHA